MPVYMKLGSIKGNVTSKGHEEWIEIDSFQFGVGRGISTPVGSTKNRETSRPSLSEISITKKMDQSTPYIFNEGCIGEKGLKTQFHFSNTSGTYLEIELENTLVSGYSVSSGTDNPMENVSLNYTKIVLKYIPRKEDHAKEAPHPAGYDLASGTKV